MTVPATARRAGPYSGNGSTTSFSFSFKTFAAGDLEVTKTSATGIESVLVLNSDYSVTLNGDQDASPGGSITYPISGSALASGEKLTIVGDLAYEQTTDLLGGGAFNARVIEDTFDRTVVQIQQLEERTDRALTLPVSATASTVLPVPSAGKVIAWDSTASALVNVDSTDLASTVAYANWRTDTFNGNGSTTQFTLAADPGNVNNLDIAIGGVVQTPTTDYTVSGTTLTFTSAPPSGTANVVVRYGQALPVGTANASLVTFDPAGTGATSRTVQAKLREWVSVKDFGAVGDGVTNDTAAINAALSHTYTRSLALFFPAGSYLYDGGGALGNGNIIFGEGRNATFIRSRLASPTSGYLIRALGYGSGIRDVAFYANVTQTGGSYVWLSGPETFIENFYMTGDFVGVWMTGNVSRIQHGRFQDGAAGAIRIKAEGGDNSQLIHDVLMGAQSPQVSSAGIRVRNSAALIISDTSVIEQGHALLVDPFSNTTGTNTVNTDSGSVFSLYVNNCFFDNSGGNGIRIAPTGNANVVRCRFSNVWTGSSIGDGIYINNAGSGIVAGMHFESCHSVLNAGAGLTLGGTVSDIAITGGEICQNSYGVYVNNTVTNFKVMGATIGAGAGLNGNTNVGIAFDAGASASNNIVIADNVMTGNGGSAISASSVTGSAVSIYGNIGAAINTWNPAITFATPGNLSVAYSAQSGSYTRVGNLITATFVIATSAFTHTTASGALRITGLPFESGAQTAEGALECQGITKAGYTNFTLNVASGATLMTVRASGSGVAIGDVLAADVPTGGSVTLRGSITYFV